MKNKNLVSRRGAGIGGAIKSTTIAVLFFLQEFFDLIEKLGLIIIVVKKDDALLKEKKDGQQHKVVF